MSTPWDQRFFSSTRGQIVLLLRRSPRTVEDLAAALGLTDNAVRAQLTVLERDGLARQSGLRRGTGKPSYLYALSDEAERLFPKAYAPVLGALLDVLGDQLAPDVFERVLRRAGEQLAAAEAGKPSADRIAAAIGVLEGLGGVIRVEEGPSATRLHGSACPLAALVPDHPEVCRLAESLLSAVVGAPVVERCERGDPPHCRFELARPEHDAA